MSRIIRIICLLLMVLLVPAARADSPDAIGTQGLMADSFLYYQRLVLQPDLVEFAPTKEIFEGAVSFIKADFFEDISESRLQDGCEKELRKLLRAVKITDFPQFREGRLASGFIDEALEKTKGKLEPRLVLYAALQGLFDSLDDPYSCVLSPKDYSELSEQLQSEEYGGIGATIEAGEDKSITFVEVAEGGPAGSAGIRPGDILIEIEGTPADRLFLDQIATKLRGLPDSSIHLKVRASSDRAARDVTVTRKRVVMPSVAWKMLENSIGYVQIKSFAKETSEELDKAVKELKDSGATSLILDVRNNGGGYVGAGLEVCSRFLEKGTVIMQIKYRGGKTQTMKVQESKLVKLPSVLLVNEFSCSASELTAAALKDEAKMTLIGARTFGKGCGQEVLALPGGAAMKLTEFNFFSPKGSRIHKKGIMPTIQVPMSPLRVGSKNDLQLQAAVLFLKEKKN